MDNNDCKHLVTNVWVNRCGSTAMEGVLGNIRLCGIRLDSWNNLNRRRMKEEIFMLKRLLQDAYNDIGPGS